MINLKLSGIAAAAGFILSLLVGVASGGALGFSLFRAFFCGLAFLILSGLVWALIHQFLPELLTHPEEDSLLLDSDAGSRVNISVEDEDDSIPVGAVIPEENRPDNDLGNISDLVAPERSVSSEPKFTTPPEREQEQDNFPWEPTAPVLQEIPLEDFSPDSPLDLSRTSGEAPPRPSSEVPRGTSSEAPRGTSSEAPRGGEPQPKQASEASPPVPPPRGGDAGMDQNVKKSYTITGNISPKVEAASGPSPLPLAGMVFGDAPGFDTLPDLDAMAGAFMSSDSGGEEDVAPSAFPAERKMSSTNKGDTMGGDFNSKELASAIQTILKKD